MKKLISLNPMMALICTLLTGCLDIPSKPVDGSKQDVATQKQVADTLASHDGKLHRRHSDETAIL